MAWWLPSKPCRCCCSPAVRRARPELGVLVVTHYRRILDRLHPDFVHLLVDGRIVTSGGPELANRLEEEGYEAWR